VSVVMSASALLYALFFFALALGDVRYLTSPIVAGALALAFALSLPVRRAQRGPR